MNNSLPGQVPINKTACLIWPSARVTANKSMWTCVMHIYAIRHNPLCSMQKYFLLPPLLWVLGSISTWIVMSRTSVFRLETRKYCRGLFTTVYLEVIPSLLSTDNKSRIKIIQGHMLLSCQLLQELLQVPGTELGLTSRTEWCPFQEAEIVSLGYFLKQITNGTST